MSSSDNARKEVTDAIADAIASQTDTAIGQLVDTGQWQVLLG